jgi:uncharacterized protein YhbP (UPF0306 family)
VRETPLHLGHLRLMERASDIGAVIFPPMPAFYNRPQTLDEIIDGTVGRVLARLGLDNELFTRWNGMREATVESTRRIVSASAREQFAAFLSEQTTLTLATTNADGSPHACDVFYAQDNDSSLYFLSDPKTQHIQNMVRSPRVSATVHGATRGWENIRGAQIVGDAVRVGDASERVRAFGLYVTKYPFVRRWLSSADMLDKRSRKSVWLKCTRSRRVGCAGSITRKSSGTRKSGTRDFCSGGITPPLPEMKFTWVQSTRRTFMSAAMNCGAMARLDTPCSCNGFRKPRSRHPRRAVSE